MAESFCKSGVRLYESQHVPLQIRPLRAKDPRSVFENATLQKSPLELSGFQRAERSDWKRGMSICTLPRSSRLLRNDLH